MEKNEISKHNSKSRRRIYRVYQRVRKVERTLRNCTRHYESNEKLQKTSKYARILQKINNQHSKKEEEKSVPGYTKYSF